MSQVIENIDVNVPVTTAYNQWTQFESYPQFMSEVDAIRQLDDTHVRWTVTIAGAERTFDTEITEQHPDERVAWKSIDGEVQHAGVVTFHRLDDTSTRVTVQIDWEPSGALETVGALFGVDDHAVKKDLGNFKKLVEAHGAADGAWRGDVARP